MAAKLSVVFSVVVATIMSTTSFLAVASTAADVAEEEWGLTTCAYT